MKIMAALQVSKYRAAYLPGPMSYRIFQNTTKYSPRYPTAPRGEPANLTVNLEPIRVIQSNPANRELITDNQGNTGIPIIPALDHANDCLCAAPTANNNIESLHPLRMCMPNELFINSYLEHKDLPTGHNQWWPNHRHRLSTSTADLDLDGRSTIFRPFFDRGGRSIDPFCS
jgi:hypothetical protein